jgi:hypothetical protein
MEPQPEPAGGHWFDRWGGGERKGWISAIKYQTSLSRRLANDSNFVRRTAIKTETPRRLRLTLIRALKQVRKARAVPRSVLGVIRSQAGVRAGAEAPREIDASTTWSTT